MSDTLSTLVVQRSTNDFATHTDVSLSPTAQSYVAPSPLANEKFRLIGTTLTGQVIGSEVVTNAGSSNPPGTALFAKALGTPYGDNPQCVAVDSQGNIWLAGSMNTEFGGAAQFPVLIKMTPSGTILLQNYYYPGGGSISAIAIDSNDNVLITGQFTQSLDFSQANKSGAAFDLGSPNLKTSVGFNDIFVAKLSSTGAHIWSLSFGSGAADFNASRSGDLTGTESGFAIAIDPSTQDVVVAGVFLGNMTVLGTALTNSGGTDIFLIKLAAANGAKIFVDKYGSTGGDAPTSLAIDLSRNIYLCGMFSQTVDFSKGAAAALTATTTLNLPDIFVAKFSALGVHQWSKNYGGAGDDRGYCIKLDPTGTNLYVGGDFSGTVNFGAGTTTKTALGLSDLFLMKILASNGSVVWVQTFGGNNSGARNEFLLGIAVNNSSGNVTVCGGFIGTMLVGGAGGVTLTAKNVFDAFVACFSSAGVCLWARSIGSNTVAGESATGIALDSNGDPWVVGVFTASVDLGNNITITPIGNNGTSDWFVIKYQQ